MRTLLLLLTLAFATTTRAAVVVYKGSGTCLQPTDTQQFGKTPRLYYIVDLATNEAFPIFYFTLNGKKQSQGTLGSLSPTRYNAAPGPRGKTFGNFSFAFDSGTANFDVFIVYLRGKAVTLPTSSSSTGIFPKTLVGILRGASRNNGNPFNSEINLVLTYDSFHTQAANNGFKSGFTVYTDILSELAAKGYQ